VNIVKYAIFGGSFNPIHNGHIIIVQKMLDYIEGLQKLFVIPAGCSPFKRQMENQLPFEYRYSWCSQVFSKIDGTDSLDIERDDEADTPSFTYQTIERFYELYHAYPVVIIGEDSLSSFHKWKYYERILERCELAVFKRRDFSGKVRVDPKYLQKIKIYDSPYIEISSTEIRERIKENKSIKGYVPESLEEDIIKRFIKNE
jgi:nicotinate-nucleotide adenylyltransferase